MSTRSAARAALVLVALAVALAVGALLGVAASPSGADAVQSVQPAPVVEPAPATEPAYTDDEAFLADLFGPDTDVSPEQAASLIDLAHRYCDKVGHPEQLPPGAEVQTREGWIAGLTAPGPHAFTLDEAGKLLDVATAAYCPALFG